MVGAVVVRHGVVVGEGWHQQYGGPHAEVHALQDAGDRAQGATLYVTLEPCCHHGKTPPCTDRILAAGIRRVVVAMGDPFPQVAGRGLRLLRDAGLDVEVGRLEAAARQLNAPYTTLLGLGRPYVHAKWAMTLDGRIATVGGQSQWITGPDARAHGHRFRGLVDGIVAGIGTALADDPRLTARPVGPRNAARIIFDSQARLPLQSQLVRSALEAPVLVVTLDEASAAPNQARLERAGCEILRLPPDAVGRPSVTALLAELGRRRWTNLLVEGGAGVLGAFLAADCIDAARVYVAGAVVGGQHALGPVGDPGIPELARALRLGPLETCSVGDDVFLSSARVPKLPGTSAG